MNRFRTKKKAKDGAASRPAEEQHSLPSFKNFRIGKKSQEAEQKKEIDLTSALPPSDDFRTSLLMTGLSARFSMLREQDDPNTKIGKASDDSVLFPKRQSRLMDYGFGAGLADIAEVESIKAPPSFTRNDSYVTDDTDSAHAGSIMDRAKPVEGNNLFGGRQKIYKITGGSGSGVMGGRALYENDVARSAFQKWKRDEKDRKTSFDYDEKEVLDELQNPEDYPYLRSESPFTSGYSQRRATSSTTSSTPSLARNSTAATSVTSQPTPSIKDWQSQSTAPTSASSTPVVERNVTRTRRLYEQGLTQDLQDQQSFALNRIDTLSGKRTFGSRTPDVAQNSPSPTTYGFADRFGGDRFGADRRPVMTKASAPNLRSISPPATASSVGTMDLGIKVPAIAETRNDFAGTPPLSPPISDEGDHPLLPIQPNDRGKATAMGVFSKPAQPYDESKFAQRQLQLQQGRDTPTQVFRTESDPTLTTSRSRSSSTQHRNVSATQLNATAKIEASMGTTFFDEDDDFESSPDLSTQSKPILPALSHLQRPSDDEHPALRQSALPTPLSASSKISDEPSPLSEKPDLSARSSHQVSPEDSPTLGPTAGLSGMVRQHMRSESNTSSNYGGASGGLESRFPMDNRESHFEGLGGFGVKALGNPWEDQDWNLSVYGAESFSAKNTTAPVSRPETIMEQEQEQPHSQDSSNRTSDAIDKEEDDFANQLANARRRVQERLTTYVESDSSRAASPLLPPTEPPTQPPPRSNPLGILRGKSSRGSLMERPREPSQSKAMKLLGIGATTMSTTPSPSKQTFEDGPLANTGEDLTPLARENDSEADAETESQLSRKSNDEDNNVHPGLRAFRQARRDLQRRKELEMLARHQGSTDQGERQPPKQTTPGRDRANTAGQQTPSRDRKPPPVYYQQRAPSEESSSRGPASRSPSRPPTERDRSGSEASNGRSFSRPPRLRNNSNPVDDNQRQLGPNGGPRPMMRSPGLPGTDIKRSPFLPPQGYPNGALPSPVGFERSASSGNLNVHTSISGQSSPALPLSAGLPSSPFMGSAPGSGATTPTTRRPSAPPTPGYTTTSSLNESMKRPVNKHQISEPTFIMSTSRVPTVNLPPGTASPDTDASRSQSGSRSRAGSNAAFAPPLPPINPMRKREGSRTRGMLGALGMGRKGEMEGSASTPHLPLSNSGNSHGSTFSASDDEDEKSGRRWMRKQNTEAHGMNNRMAGPVPPRREHRVSPPYQVAAGPPASRTMITPSNGGSAPPGMI